MSLYLMYFHYLRENEFGNMLVLGTILDKAFHSLKVILYRTLPIIDYTMQSKSCFSLGPYITNPLQCPKMFGFFYLVVGYVSSGGGGELSQTGHRGQGDQFRR